MFYNCLNQCTFYFLECPVGSFGQDCQEKCGKCKSGITCNITTGVCHDGCEDGYEGEYCTTKPPGNSCMVSHHYIYIYLSQY